MVRDISSIKINIKYLNYLITILILISGCSPKEVDISELKFGESPLVADSIFIKDQQTTLVFYKGEKFSGYSIEKYGNGKTMSKLEFKDGLSDGTQEEFYLKGNPRFLCTCKRGHLIKGFKQYFENGNIKRTGNYNNDGLIEGIATSYFEDGSIHESVSLKNDNYDGPYVEYFPNGKVYRKINYVKGIKEGDAEMFNEDGSSKGKVVFSNGIIKEASLGESISSENSSTTSTIIIFQKALNALGYNIPGANGTLDATTKKQLTSFQEDYQLETSIGKIDRATAKMLVLALKQKNVQGSEQLQNSLNSLSLTSSSSPSIDDNAIKPTIEKIDYNDGHRYYIGEVKNGLQNGKGKLFVDNVLRYDGDWVNDKFNGVGIYYHENGRLRYKGEFKDNKMDGRGILYSDPEGNPLEGEWRDGQFFPQSNSLESSSINSSINTNGQDIVNCSYCGKKFQMKDGYVQTSTNKTAYFGWTQLLNIETAKKSGYSQETINQLSIHIKYGHWYCSKKCAYESGVHAVDE